MRRRQAGKDHSKIFREGHLVISHGTQPKKYEESGQFDPNLNILPTPFPFTQHTSSHIALIPSFSQDDRRSFYHYNVAKYVTGRCRLLHFGRSIPLCTFKFFGHTVDDRKLTRILLQLGSNHFMECIFRYHFQLGIICMPLYSNVRVKRLPALSVLGRLTKKAFQQVVLRKSLPKGKRCADSLHCLVIVYH